MDNDCVVTKGRFVFNRKITKKLADYLEWFSKMRHVKRDNQMIKKFYPNWQKNRCFFGCLGDEGEFFLAFYNDTREDVTVIDVNTPPSSQPNLFCGWTVSDNRKFLEWDDSIEFCDAVEWLKYIIENFIKTDPHEYKLNGEVTWENIDTFEKGVIIVKNNTVL